MMEEEDAIIESIFKAEIRSTLICITSETYLNGVLPKKNDTLMGMWTILYFIFGSQISQLFINQLKLTFIKLNKLIWWRFKIIFEYEYKWIKLLDKNTKKNQFW